jgi:hypothetical protein
MWSVNAPGFRTDDRRRHTAAATVTHYADQFLGGTHEFKFGVEYERSHAVVHKGYPGGILYLDYGGEPYMAYLQEPYWMRSSAARTTAYGQDRWRVGPVTLSPGVRVDVNRGSVPGKPGVFATTPVSPRFGVAWDLFADHSTVVRAHYGRYHDAMFANRFWYLDPGSVSPAYVARVVGPNQFQILSEWDFASTDRIDPHLRQSFVDQYVAGVERELVTDASLQVQYIARRFGNFMGWQNADALWSPLVAHDPGPDGKAGTADDGGDLAYYVRNNPGVGVSVLSNPEGLYRRYDAIQVVLRKRYSRNWQLQASYTWSRSSGTVRNLDYVNAGYSDLSPGFPITPNTFANSPGRPPYDPQEFKAFGTYRWNPWGGINASAIFTWRSGSTWTRTVFVPGVGNLRAEPLGARRLPATRALDLRVDKTMRLPGRAGTLSAFLDIFNVTNQGIQTGASARSGPTLGQPAGWSDPRMFRVGVRVAF